MFIMKDSEAVILVGSFPRSIWMSLPRRESSWFDRPTLDTEFIPGGSEAFGLASVFIVGAWGTIKSKSMKNALDGVGSMDHLQSVSALKLNRFL